MVTLRLENSDYAALMNLVIKHDSSTRLQSVLDDATTVLHSVKELVSGNQPKEKTWKILRYRNGNTMGTGLPIASGIDDINEAAKTVLELYRHQDEIGGNDVFEALPEAS